MKPYYLVFAGDDYYPAGGAYDLASAPQPSLSDAVGTAATFDRDWWHIARVSKDGLKVVAFWRKGEEVEYVGSES